MYYFYVLQLGKNGQYYYGSTSDLKRRVKEHEGGQVYFTKHRRPINLLYYEAYNSLNQARSREKQVKASSSIRLALHKRIIPQEVPAPDTGQPDF